MATRPASNRRRRLAALTAAALAALAALAPAACGGSDGGATPEPPGPAGGDADDAAAAVDVRRGIAYTRRDGPALDVYRARHGGEAARGNRRRPAVLVLHGGSWRYGDKADVEPTATALARAGFVAFAVGYTLAGEGRAGYPRQPRQVRAALRYVRRNAARFGIDPSRVGALGISAGAHLAALVGAAGGRRGDGRGRPDAVVAWSGPFDLRAPRLRRVLDPEVAGFLGCVDCPRRAALASPISHVSRDDPAILIVNSRQELIPASQAWRMARRARRAGARARLLILPGQLHAPLFEPEAIGPTIGFLRRQLR